MCRRKLGAVLLLFCLYAQTMGQARSASITFDEGPHLAVGYATLRTGDLRLQPVHIHPPLANVLAAAPLLLQTDLPDPRSVDGWEIASLSAITDAVVWQYPYPRRLAASGRLPIILMTVLLGAIVFRWASDLFGKRAGLFALGLYAFDPNVIAHGSLVTTDMALVLWGTAALFLSARHLRHPHRGIVAATGAALGLALASKVSAVSLLPAVGLLWLLGPRSLPWPKRLSRAMAVLIVAFVVLWAVYGFEVGRLPDLSVPVPAATHLRIYRSLQEHYRLGHPSFLMGQNSERGWWTYFPAAFALKTPVVTLLLLAASAVCGLLAAKSVLRAPRRWGPLLLYPLLYGISSLLSTVNIGYRHLLPILPLLFVSVAPLFSLLASRLSPLAYRLGLGVLAAWYVVGTLRVFPHYVAYFNELAGGPAGGYRYLVDSNLDWGQNLWQLRDWMRENQVQRVYYAHFSPARPDVYGVAADFLPPDPRSVPFAPLAPAAGVYAVGATVLQGVYTADVNTYAWFRSHEPVDRLGYAVFLYEVPPRPQTAWVAICADPAPLLSPEEVQARFGRNDLRLILVECDHAWVYAAGGGTGAYLLPEEAAPPPGAVLEVTARRSDGSPFYSLYRLQGERPAPVRPMEDVAIEGPLAFLGYRLDPAGLQPGETLELQTHWRVEELPHRPLSIMAHLVGPDGAPVAVGDGLGVPVERWQPGDVLVQRHFLQVPDGTPEGRYELQTGAYWLETMERWSVRDASGRLGDRIVLTAVTVEDEGGSSDHR